MVRPIVSVFGLGYVGLPLAVSFSKKFKTIGFDINAARVEALRQKLDKNGELSAEELSSPDLTFTSKLTDVSQASFHIVAVPTPIDGAKQPDLTPLIKASESLGKILKPGDIVVYESTVYPGATEEVCVPILEKVSGLKGGDDFKVGYSPERINPGDTERTFEKICKVVSGQDAETLEKVAFVYGEVVRAGVYKAQSIRVAEAAKAIENTQRDLNIALMNELAIIFNRLGIQTQDVLNAAFSSACFKSAGTLRSARIPPNTRG
jgi:UDP-N-acetyl-D-galactosamine dehydrogenase